MCTAGPADVGVNQAPESGAGGLLHERAQHGRRQGGGMTTFPGALSQWGGAGVPAPLGSWGH